MDSEKRLDKQYLKDFFAIVGEQYKITVKRLGTDKLPSILQQMEKYDPNRQYSRGCLKPGQSPDEVTISAKEFKPIVDFLSKKPEIITYVNEQCFFRFEDSPLGNFLHGCENLKEWLKKWNNANPIAYARMRGESIGCLMWLEKELKENGEIPKTPQEIQGESDSEKLRAATHEFSELVYILSSKNPGDTLKQMEKVRDYPLSEYPKRKKTRNDITYETLEEIRTEITKNKKRIPMGVTAFYSKKKMAWRQSFISENIDGHPKYLIPNKKWKQIKVTMGEKE